MRVALVYRDALRQGGYPRDLRWLAGSLAGRGVSVTVVAEPGGEGDGLTPDVSHLGPKDEAARHERWDVVHHAFGLFIPTQLRLSCSLSGRVLVVSTGAHAMPLHLRQRWWKKLPYLVWVRSLLRRRLKALHVFSMAELTWARRAVGADRWFVAPLGIFPEPREIAPVAPHNDVRGHHDMKSLLEEPYVLFFGRNDVVQKGIDILLRGYALAVREGFAARLVIAGQPHRNSPRRIHGLVRDERISDRVILLGAVGEDLKWSLLQRALLLAFLSRWDGPPRPIREALTMDTPVLVSWQTNLGHLVEEQGAGAAVPLYPASVAMALLEAADPARVASWREGARRLAERLAWSRVADDYLEGYLAALGGDRSA
jgi:glycosyltransferase involved in cell wall biosynthesis